MQALWMFVFLFVFWSAAEMIDKRLQQTAMVIGHCEVKR